MSVFILWAWILRVHLIATHMITWPASCQPPITSRTGPTKKQTADGLLPSDPQTSAPKIRAGKIHMFTICKFGPFPETIFQKNVVETWEWQNNFSWGEMKMGDGRADFSLFPKDPGSRILFVWDRHARSHEKRKAVAVKPLRCMAALRLNKSVLVHPQRVDWTWPAELETLLSAVTACVWKMSRGSNMFKPKNVLIMKEEVSWLVWQQKGGNFSRPEKNEKCSSYLMYMQFYGKCLARILN